MGHRDLQTLSTDIYQLHIRAMQAYSGLLLYYINASVTDNNKLLSDDLKYSEGLLSNAISQLQPVQQKLLAFDSNEATEMKELVVQVSAYVREDVSDMALLTLDAGVASTFGGAADTAKIDLVKNIHAKLGKLVEYYKFENLEAVEEELKVLEEDLTDLQNLTAK